MTYQKIIIVGNLGSDPEMRYMPDGTAVTSMSVATTRKWNGNNGEPMKETLWFRVNVWGRQAESCNQYLARGRKVLVEGVLQGDAATGGPKTFTRQDGTVGASFEIRAFEVKFLSVRYEDAEATSSATSGSVSYGEDYIPF